MYNVTLHIDNTKMLILHSVNTKQLIYLRINDTKQDSVLDDPLVVDFKLLSPVLQSILTPGCTLQAYTQKQMPFPLSSTEYPSIRTPDASRLFPLKIGVTRYKTWFPVFSIPLSHDSFQYCTTFSRYFFRSAAKESSIVFC